MAISKLPRYYQNIKGTPLVMKNIIHKKELSNQIEKNYYLSINNLI